MNMVRVESSIGKEIYFPALNFIEHQSTKKEHIFVIDDSFKSHQEIYDHFGKSLYAGRYSDNPFGGAYFGDNGNAFIDCLGYFPFYETERITIVFPESFYEGLGWRHAVNFFSLVFSIYYLRPFMDISFKCSVFHIADICQSASIGTVHVADTILNEFHAGSDEET